VSIAGPDLFTQFLPHEGDVPPTETLQSVSCVEGMSVWLSDLENDPDAVMTRIEHVLDRVSNEMALDQPDDRPSTTDNPTQMSVTPAVAPEPARSLLTQSAYWSAFTDARSPPILGDTSKLGPGVGLDPAAITRAINEVVELEGPIKEDRLASIVVGRFGMSKVKAARLAALQPMFRHLSATRTVFGVVYWSSSRMSDTWTGFRTSPVGNSRPIEDVPAEELSNAMVAVIKMGNTATEEEILRMVADAHDRKLTEKVRTLLSAILSWTVDSGRLVLEGAYYRLP